MEFAERMFVSLKEKWILGCSSLLLVRVKMLRVHLRFRANCYEVLALLWFVCSSLSNFWMGLLTAKCMLALSKSN